jgi:hypothetical protein
LCAMPMQAEERAEGGGSGRAGAGLAVPLGAGLTGRPLRRTDASIQFQARGSGQHIVLPATHLAAGR